MNGGPNSSVTQVEALRRRLAAAEQELAEARKRGEERQRELDEALERQAATSEILQVISRLRFDLEPLLEALVEHAARLCGAESGIIYRGVGGAYRMAAAYGISTALRALEARTPVLPGRATVAGRVARDRRVHHVPDVAADPEYAWPEGQRAGAYRTLLGVPLLRDGVLIGVMVIYRTRVQPFTERQITLVSTFADQAVIAMETVRQFHELESQTAELARSVEQLRALGEVSQAVSSSLELRQVLATIVRRAVSLSDAVAGGVFELDAVTRVFVGVASHNLRQEYLDSVQRTAIDPSHALLKRAAEGAAPVQISDIEHAHDYAYRDLQLREGFRAMLVVPIPGGPATRGLVVFRQTPGVFQERVVTLLTALASQSKVAIDNARLFEEVQSQRAQLERLSRNVAQLYRLSTAMQEPLSLREQLQRVLESAREVVSLDRLYVWAVSAAGDSLVSLAGAGFSEPELDAFEGAEIPLAEAGAMGKAYREGVPLVFDEDNPIPPELRLDPAHLAIPGVRTKRFLVVPMVARGHTVGLLTGDNKPTRRPICPDTVDLLRTFASHAAVAVDNARLFQELQVRSRELTRSVEELRTLGEVSQAVNSTLDLETVLTTIVARAAELSGSDGGAVYEYEERTQLFRPRAAYRVSPRMIAEIEKSPIRLGEQPVGRAALNREPDQIPDISNPPPDLRKELRDLTVRGGIRALLSVPLLREDRILGCLLVGRRSPGRFAQETVDLLQTLATQSALALQNARLFHELEDKSRQLEKASRTLEQLYRLSTAIQEPLSLNEQLTRDFDTVRRVIGIDRFVIWLTERDGATVTILAGAGLSPDEWQELQGLRIPLAAAPALAKALRENAPALYGEANPVPPGLRLRVPYAAISQLRTKCLAIIPMVARGRPIGLLTADNRRSRAPIDRHTVDLVQVFASHAAVAIENARLFQELEDKTRQLEVADRHKSEFLAGMSHELRTPLNAIIGYSEMLCDEAADLGGRQLVSDLRKITMAGRHLLELIDAVLDLSKIEAGKMELQREEFGVPSLVTDVIAVIEPLAERNGNRLDVQCEPGVGTMHTDRTKLRQIILNLLGNACKFTERGVVSMIVGREIAAAGERMRFTVRDTGIGMTPEQVARLFHEFVQVEASVTRRYGGTGLGLALSRRLCDMMGGEIIVESEPGKGSTFVLSVPVRIPEAGSSPESRTST